MQGYNELAGFIGASPRLAIFRRFLPLHARNILCMEAELVNLEAGLCRTIRDDRNTKDSHRRAFEFDVAAMKGPHQNPADAVQWTKTQELRPLLKDYGMSSLNSFESPSRKLY